jgi:hypothetical protein
LRRTNDDKRRAVTVLLSDEEWRKWPLRKIARHCAVDEGLVRKVAKELTADNPQLQRPSVREVETSDGRSYEIDTANIGKVPTILPSSEPAPFVALQDDIAAPANDNRAAYRTSFTGENEWYTPERQYRG